MDKTKTRIILVLLAVIVLGGSYFGVLQAEQRKRLAARSLTQSDIEASLADAERLRQEYFVAIDARKAELKQLFDASKSQYTDLLQKQPALIDANKRGVSVPVTKTVTTQVPATPVITAKPQATRKTKTS